MNWRTLLLPLASLATAALAGCAVPPNQVVPQRDGVLRATTYVQADDYCRERNASPKWLGRAPAESGVLFRCTTD